MNGIPIVEPGHDADAQISLSTTNPDGVGTRAAVCSAFAFAAAYPLGEATPPSMQIPRFTVAVQSGALLYGSRKANHDWLQAKLDAKSKQQEDAAKARSAPKF